MLLAIYTVNLHCTSCSGQSFICHRSKQLISHILLLLKILILIIWTYACQVTPEIGHASMIRVTCTVCIQLFFFLVVWAFNKKIPNSRGVSEPFLSIHLTPYDIQRFAVEMANEEIKGLPLTQAGGGSVGRCSVFRN